jgi:glycosyltransferase involved in cell wall biosynthesis
VTETPVNSSARCFAVYGFIDEHAGSQASASYKIVERMLLMGHEIHLYAIDGFITPGNLAKHPNLTYLPVKVAACTPIWQFLKRRKSQRVRNVLEFSFAKVSTFLHMRLIRNQIAAHHAAHPFDALISFGLLSPCRLRNARTISWPQGPPNGEFEWILNNRRQLINRLGFLYVLFLVVLYFFKCITARFAQRRSDLIIGGSRWTLSMWRKLGVQQARLASLPYPIDLVDFDICHSDPHSARESAGTFTFLHLGRIVPRKRLDLLLDAFDLVRKTEPLSRLLIIGSFSYATAYRSLLDRYAQCDQVDYREKVPRSDVPALLRSVGCSIQTSEHEDFGSTIAESLACGTPVVLGPSNGTGDYVPGNCVKFKAYSPQDVADAMLTTLRAVRTGGQSIGESCRKAAETWFNAEQIALQLLTLALPAENDALSS